MAVITTPPPGSKVRHQGSCPVRREAARARKSRLLGRRSRGEQHERDSNPASPAGAPPSPAGGAQEEAVYAASGDVGNFVDDAALEVADEGADPFTASGPAAAAVPAAGAGLEVADEQHSPIQQGAAHASAVARATAVGLDYSSARLAAWAQEANSGRGLPDSDVNTLLSLLREPDFSITSLEFRNARQLKAFQDQVAFGVGFGGSEFEEIILTQPGEALGAWEMSHAHLPATLCQQWPARMHRLLSADACQDALSIDMQ